MSKGYTFITNLSKEFGEIPRDSIISRTVYNDEHLKAVLFAFDKGQELSEHTASMSATIHIIQGEAKLKLGDDSVEAETEAWIHMPAGLRHAIYANTPLVMLLVLVKAKQ